MRLESLLGALGGFLSAGNHHLDRAKFAGPQLCQSQRRSSPTYSIAYPTRDPRAAIRPPLKFSRQPRPADFPACSITAISSHVINRLPNSRTLAPPLGRNQILKIPSNPVPFPDTSPHPCGACSPRGPGASTCCSPLHYRKTWSGSRFLPATARPVHFF
jgi:hypothetical protein